MRSNNNQNQRRGRNRPGRRAPTNRTHFDSNGPNVRIRGSASQIYEKYIQLARDAASSDRVLAENLLQHAEHYFRIANVDSDDHGHDRDQRRRRQENGGYNEAAGYDSTHNADEDETEAEAEVETVGQSGSDDGEGQSDGNGSEEADDRSNRRGNAPRRGSRVYGRGRRPQQGDAEGSDQETSGNRDRADVRDPAADEGVNRMMRRGRRPAAEQSAVEQQADAGATSDSEDKPAPKRGRGRPRKVKVADDESKPESDLFNKAVAAD